MAYYEEKNEKSFNHEPPKNVAVPYKRFQLLSIDLENFGILDWWSLTRGGCRSKMTHRGNNDGNLKTKPGGYIHMYW